MTEIRLPLFQGKALVTIWTSSHMTTSEWADMLAALAAIGHVATVEDPAPIPCPCPPPSPSASSAAADSE